MDTVEPSCFNSIIKKVDDKVELHFIEIEELNDEMKRFIDDNLVSICRGIYNKSSVQLIRKKASRFFENKDNNTRIGATAEFFMHLYLKTLNFGQECMFLNMEENSIKKGFDGYYSKGNEEWILESKSGDISTKNISHSAKVKEAYKSLRGQLAGEGKNDPWQNAYQHANSRDVLTNDSILKKLQDFSEDFEYNVYHSTKELNIIPAATIFLNNKWEAINVSQVYKELNGVHVNFEYQKLIIICCTKKSVDLFMDYLNVPKKEK